jgi:signal transduction histidine kinase
MLDDALAGRFDAQDYDESMLSKVESKMARFLDASRLRRAQIEGEQERVRSLISDISHQTKTPLANISLYAQLFAEQDLNEEQATLARQISQSADKLNFLIQSLVKTSRFESGIVRIEPASGDVRDLINTSVAECAADATDKNIHLVAAASNAPLIAKYDPRWCGEALVNIIDNAIKYTLDHGSVNVSAAAYEMLVRLDVADTGKGIREADLPKVFERFWRAEESAESPGVGLGLYLAREIITACGGYIKVESQLGAWTKFSVFLSKV